MTESLQLTYDLRLLPRGRFTFRRWRWELWHRDTLLAAGWQLHPLQAQRTVRVHAVRYAHRLRGLRVLRPDVEHPEETPWRNRPVTILWGELQIELVPRGDVEPDGRLGQAVSA